MERARFRPAVGAEVQEGGVRFRVWAPAATRVEVMIEGGEGHPLEAEDGGYFSGRVEGVGAGTRYRYRLDGGEAYPDPASRYQPEGVHGPSEVIDPTAYRWGDGGWRGRPLEELVIYELHIGTFTHEGSFAAAAARLPEIAELGVTAVEVMPIANFPGERNWGYDGVNLYAPATAYGRPDDFRHFVDAAHRLGLAVILDVVYNHLGPDGNYIPAVTGGRYFTDRHHTPWGDAINFDGDGSGAVREFVLQNALFWVHEYHVDGLRLDATHAIVDDSPRHILSEVAEAVRGVDERPRVVIAEDERNERRVILPESTGGLGLDAVWADDLHHQLRRLAAGDDEGYFADFSGTVGDLVATLRQGWFYEGQPAVRSGRGRGTAAGDIPPRRFVHCIQNHDQVGNRAMGERLNHQIPPALYRAVSTLLLFSPYTPLLWMGQEWAAGSPFLYFTDHHPELGRLVTEGRREEFSHFSAFADESRRDAIPDPQDRTTFERSRLRWEEREAPEHAGVLRLYREMLELRRTDPALRAADRGSWRVDELGAGAVALRRGDGEGALLLLVNFRGEIALAGDTEAIAAPDGLHWSPVLTSEDLRFGGSGAWGRLEADGAMQLVGPVAVLLRAVG